jgi:hypothetical protein
MSKLFQKRIEDFVCEQCGLKNFGNGFTNHCRGCLHSKHIDINPGDRAAVCGGLMEPTKIEQRGQKMFVVLVCKKCRFQRRNTISPLDDLEVVLCIMRKARIQ